MQARQGVMPPGMPPQQQEIRAAQEVPFTPDNVIKMLHTLHSDVAQYSVADR